MEKVKGHRKSSMEIYAVLKDQIQYLTLEPGAHVREPELVEQFGVSRTPIREALLRLSTEGLVDILPQNGTYISKINFRLATEIAFIRHLLDSDVCLSLCRARASVRELTDEALYFMSVAAKKKDTVAFIRQDDRFHRELFHLAGHEESWNIVSGSHAHNNRVRMLDMQRPDELRPSLEEHERIAACIESGDEAALSEIMARHHDHVYDEARERMFRELYPHYFA